MQADANFDLIELDRAVADIEERARRLGPAWRDLRKPLRGDQRQHAQQEEGPTGKWAPRSPFTEAKRQARNRSARTTKAMRTIAVSRFKRRSTPKRILGRGPSAVFVTIGELFIRVTNRIPWWSAQQLGRTVGRHAKLPARVSLWLSSGIVAHARDVLRDHILKGWKK